MDRLVIVPLVPALYNTVIDFTYKHFFPREPLAVASGFGRVRDPEYIKDMMSKFVQGISLAAVDPQSGELVGIAINTAVKKTDSADLSQMADDRRTIYEFLDFIERGIDVFEAFNVDKGFEIYFLGVHSSYGGQGIAGCLLKHSLELARQCGFIFVRSNPTNPITMHMYEKAGFTTLNEAKLCDFLKKNGDPCFPNARKTDAVRLCVKLL